MKTVNGDLMNNISTLEIGDLIKEERLIVNAKEDLELLELKKKLIDGNIGDGNKRYDDIIEDIVDQENVIFEVYLVVNILNQSKNNYLIAHNTLKINEREYSIALIKYDSGQITFNERMSTYNQMFKSVRNI